MLNLKFVTSTVAWNKKYVLSNSESVQCNFFIFDHDTFIKFKICCCVQHFMKIRWFFTEIWRYRPKDITIFKMAAVRHLGIVLPPYETTHEVSVAGRSCLSNFMSIWYTDLKIYSYLNFSHIWLYIQAPKMLVLRDFGPLNVIIIRIQLKT